MNIKVYINTLRQKGYLAYEYNPLHNYQTDVDLYLINDTFIVPKESAVNIKNGEILIKKENEKWVDKRGRIVEDAIKAEEGDLYASAGSLIDLDTEKLNFDLDHPVDIEVQPSYDGSVNLILNDDKNIPRLINSRFSVREKNTYEVVDRIGENDTNIYNSKSFDKDTSLYFQYKENPLIKYSGFIKGNLSVGTYCFYFTYCDSDENESDYIAETGVIPVYIGSGLYSTDGGIKNQNSYKGIKLQLSNLDASYNYIKVYYVRYFADYQQNRVSECKKIIKSYYINSNKLTLQITGEELTEDIDPNILNITRFNPKSILTQAQCKNMLFFGNIVKNSDNYRELQDCALRIVPTIKEDTIQLVDNNYRNNSGYYDPTLMYEKVGYFNQEFYRFGVVFIYNNGTLSNVYNTFGYDIKVKDTEVSYNDKELFNIESSILTRNYIPIDDNGWIKNSELFFNGKPQYANSKGVCKINLSEHNNNSIFGIKFSVPNQVIKFLQEDLGIRGMFFVRQKRVPNVIAQCFLMPFDEVLEAPVIEIKDEKQTKHYTECFLGQKNTSNELEVVNYYDSRLYQYKNSNNKESSISKNAYAAICPDFFLNQPYYNQIFNGQEFRLQEIKSSKLKRYEKSRFYNDSQDNEKLNFNHPLKSVIISSVTEDVPSVALKDKMFKLEVGNTEEVFRFKYAEIDSGLYDAGNNNKKGENKDVKNINKATNLVRGMYSPYLAIYSEEELNTSALYNIYLKNTLSQDLEFKTRMDSTEPFYAISDRYNFENLTDYEITIEDQEISKKIPTKSIICWRGDCFINTYTHRLNRNFNDPTLPNNDTILDSETWKNNYDVGNPEKWEKIARSDINAVQMGSWITFKVRSYMNYALRSQDHSYVAEEALMGSPRNYVPRNMLGWKGNNKLPDSSLYNDAYRATLGFKCYFTLSNVNYIKDTFSNRIQYSAISIQDSFKNNYRYSLSTYFRDYSQEYGSITKLVSFEGYLLVIFEHAIGIAVINERILAGSGEGEPVFINTKNVLPEELTIITDTYGTQWTDSVIKSESGYVYGVDTIAKKIWRVKGQQLDILSDFKVNSFLVKNISLGERELYPIIGLKNVKTHYNNNKKDVMFTFYDDIYKDEEKVWNLCFNEILDEFVTFYSWVPSYSENIDTKFFSFNRDTAKGLSLLGKCNYSNPDNYGILVDNPVIKDSFTLHYIVPKATSAKIFKDGKYEYVISNTDLTDKVDFKLENDHWGNYNLFVKQGNKFTIKENAKEVFKKNKILYLEVTPIIREKFDILSDTIKNTYFKTETIAITLDEILKNPNLTHKEKSYPSLTTDFYLHGQAGLFDIKENVYPCNWYGQYHPFEFEFIVNDNVGIQKIFNNLLIISNKAEPESFHFEIEGDNYDFSLDKRNMYFRQEATKNLYQNLGLDIIYDRNFTDVISTEYTQEQYYRGTGTRGNTGLEKQNTYKYSGIDKVYPQENTGLVKQVKSTIFPLYYERIDTYNDVYHRYSEMLGNKYDFKNLSGSEISWNRILNQFNIVTHIKNSPIDHYGILRGNSLYKEGKWNIQIPSINFMQKNEDKWTNIPTDLKTDGPLKNSSIQIPPIVINSSNLPKNLPDYDVSESKLPSIYQNGEYNWINSLDTKDWSNRKETKIRDKWMKVRIRYSGKNIAIIHSIVTLYNISYA